MNINDIHKVYFIGIGGIGMSALARFFNQKGAGVKGYDKTKTPLTEQLQKEGIDIHYVEDLNALPKDADLVVYTPAIPPSHKELVWYQNNNYKVVKRSDVLQYISESMNAICVAGTHGKTTISTLIAHILRYTDYGTNAFLGGISANYGVNYWSSDNDSAVIEADEYDRSFLKLYPHIAVLTAMDADHLDIYGTVEEMENCYLQFLSNIKHALIYKHGLKRSREFSAPNKYSYSLQNDSATYYASDIKMHNGTYTFNCHKADKLIGKFELNMGGMHNVENTIAAIAVCDLLNIDVSRIQAAISAFAGVKRRFEYVIKTDKHVLIDDYAHHPEELQVLLTSTKKLFPEQKLSVVFQPHLFTRTRDLAEGFGKSLSIADEVILLDIYPARELPIEGVTSQIIYDNVFIPNKSILSKEGMLAWVQASKPGLLVTAGAGDIDALVKPIKEIIQAN